MNDFLKEALSHDWIMKYITEFIGTALMVALGNGSVANVELKGTKGNKSGWLVIGFGYGFAVMMPALMFGDVSGNHINPAFTLGLAASGLFSWVAVPGYLIAQLLGAFLGQAIVVWVHQPYYLQTENQTTFSVPSLQSLLLMITQTQRKITNVLGLMVLPTSSQVHSFSSLVLLP